MKNYIETGNAIEYTVPASTTILAGAVVVIGEMVGVAVTTGTEGQKIAVSLKGVYTLAKVSGAVTQGQKIYWNAAQSKVTTTVSTNKLVGYAWYAANSGDASAIVRLK